MAKYASKVIAVSESEKNEILQRSPNFPNIKVIHNGVIFPSKIKVLKKPSKIIIGCTSRLVNSKGIAELLGGYSKIKDIKKTELWLIGEGDERETFINLAKKLNIDKNVKFFGYKRDVWQYLKIIDIFVQPTYHEAFSVSLVEAAVSGCAIIATNVGGNPEIINKNNGILIPPKKALPITQALNKYIENPKLMKMHSEKLQKIALKDYNFDKIVKEKIIPIYEN
jgi:glycosyltransferase involved in cell wall biosynthesis